VPVIVAIGVTSNAHKQVFAVQGGDKKTANSLKKYINGFKVPRLGTKKGIISVMDNMARL
jgi:hypothetical protein